MKNKGLICLMLCLVMILQVLPVSAELLPEEDLSVQKGSHTLGAQVPVLGTEQIIKNARSVMLYEVTTDTVMYAWNADEPVYPASLVKIMTALLVLEKCKLTDIATARKEVLDTVDPNAVSSDLKDGEIMTVEDLLYCMLVDSANDASAVLADFASGSQQAFVKEMNERAAELGCTGTVFTNPSGLHNDAQVTTARDMGRILREAVKWEPFREMIATVHYRVPPTNKSEARSLETGNFLMNREHMEIYYDDRVTGGRTGVTTDGERCIAATAQENGLIYLSIIMGSASEYEEEGKKLKSFGGFPETKKLLDLGFEDYKPVQIIYSNQALRQDPVQGGSSDVVLCPHVSVSAVVPSDVKAQDLDYRFTENIPLKAPLEKDQAVAEVQIWHDGACLAHSELYTMNSVKTRQLAPVEEVEEESHLLLYVGAAVLGIVILFVLVLLISRFINQRRRAERRRRNSQSRRRSR